MEESRPARTSRNTRISKSRFIGGPNAKHADVPPLDPATIDPLDFGKHLCYAVRRDDRARVETLPGSVRTKAES